MVNGDYAPALVLTLIERLPEGSKTSALMRDETYYRAYQDIGPEYYVLAAIHDAINNNTLATGMFKKRPKIDPWPTPNVIAKKARKRKEDKPRSVEDLWHSIMGKKGR